MKQLIIFLLFLTIFSAHSRDIPKLTGPIVNETSVLSRTYMQKVSQSLLQLKKDSGIQIQLFLMNSLDGDSLEDFSIRVSDKWKIGKKGEDKGVLFLISLEDRKMRIEVGRGLEGDLTDLMASRIIGTVRPYFKQKNYEAGILAGLYSIAQVTGGELKNVPNKVRRHRRHRRKSGSLFFFILIIILSLFGRGRGGRGGRGGASLFLLGALLGGGGRSYGGGGGFSGGGSSWGGGGGGFSGGGSSGSW